MELFKILHRILVAVWDHDITVNKAQEDIVNLYKLAIARLAQNTCELHCFQKVVQKYLRGPSEIQMANLNRVLNDLWEHVLTVKESRGDILDIYVRIVLNMVREALAEMRKEKITFQKVIAFQKAIESHFERLSNLQAA